MPREVLTDRKLKALKPALTGQRFELMDAIVPGLAIRVTDKGKKTFVLVARYPGSPNPTRRALGAYGALSLEQARERSREWLALISKGIDPKEQEERQRAAEQRKRDNSFGAVVEDYLRLAVLGPDPEKPLQRKGIVVARELRDEFVNDKIVAGKVRRGLARKPIIEVDRHDIIRVVDDAVGRGARYQAHNLLGHVRTLFNWAIARGVYGLETSPCDRMKPKQVIGRKALRTRVLDDRELFVLWRAAGKLGYPYGPLFQLLALTGQRKSEVAEARWDEIDLHRRVWTIPAERMKADAPHVVPLCDQAAELLAALPRFQKRGGYVFTTTAGGKAVNGFSKAKCRLDRQMHRTFRALARKEGDATSPIDSPDFVLHDIRRTVRTRLSGLPVASDVAELVIAHARPGLRRVYDQFAYLDEKRRALELWESHLAGLLRPARNNVVPMTKHAPSA